MRKEYVYIITTLLAIAPLIALAGGDVHITEWDIISALGLFFYLIFVLPVYNLITILYNVFSFNNLRFIITRIIMNIIGLAMIGYWMYLNPHVDRNAPMPLGFKIYVVVLLIILAVDVVRLFTKRLNIGISLTDE